MNLQKLFKAQKQLDDHIVKEKGLEGQDLLDKKILALQVELGELANEWRGFKFWSGDKEPRTNIFDDDCEHCINGIDKHSPAFGPYRKCSVCSQNPLLEEYVDCLHFILSVGNEIGKKDYGTTRGREHPTDLIRVFNSLFEIVAEIKYSIKHMELRPSGRYVAINNYEVLLGTFIQLGEMLGFTWNEIEDAYYDKNKINHERQANGY